MQKLGPEQTGLLLRYFAAEEYRYYLLAWEWCQIPGALILAAVLYFAAEKRAIPQILCGLMLTDEMGKPDRDAAAVLAGEEILPMAMP